jgi:hypothetical protein
VSQRLLLVLALALAAAGPGLAATLRVPEDFPLIQPALDAAQPGDTVRVAAGIFTGPGNRGLDTRGKPLTLIGAGPGGTLIDCEGEASGFRLQGDGEARSLIRGFTVLHAVADRGAGLLCEGGRLRVESCQFIGGRADWGAGLAATWEASLRLQACHFAGNRAALGGDDLYLVGGSALLRDCRAPAAGVLTLGGAELRRLDGGPGGQ